MNKILMALLASLTLLAAPAQAEENPAVVDALSGYMDFAEYGSSLIWPEQIPADDWKKVFIVDARDAAQIAKEHIPGAVNIEWRQAVARRASSPDIACSGLAESRKEGLQVIYRLSDDQIPIMMEYQPHRGETPG